MMREMKILIVSDTHGNLKNFNEILKQESPVDMIMHLGDICRDEEEIRELAGDTCTVAMVRGNCDYFSREPDTRDFSIGNHKIHMEHGHYLPDSLNSIAYKAEELGADFVFFGHTHRPLITKVGDITIANPGSISKPRQSDGCPTYMIMEIDAQGEVHLSLKKIED